MCFLSNGKSESYLFLRFWLVFDLLFSRKIKFTNIQFPIVFIHYNSKSSQSIKCEFSNCITSLWYFRFVSHSKSIINPMTVFLWLLTVSAWFSFFSFFTVLLSTHSEWLDRCYYGYYHTTNSHNQFMIQKITIFQMYYLSVWLECSNYFFFFFAHSCSHWMQPRTEYCLYVIEW